MKAIKEQMETLVNVLKMAVVRDLVVCDDTDVLHEVLKAYNDYQESERDSVDYIFEIFNKEDLMACVKGGMNAAEIAWLYNQSQVNTTPYFFFGCNHEVVEPIFTYGELKENLIGWLDEVLTDIVTYPYAYESYKKLYVRYVTNTMIE